MRKGLTQTLMAVAVVMMAAQAMAMAPTIGDIPSPVVGDLQGVTDSNVFVYPDAFDLTTFGSDRETPASQLKWTYEVVGETPPATTYLINGTSALSAADIAAGLDTTPTANLVIAGPGANNLDTGLPMDNNPNTITIRNQHLSPVNNPAGADQAGSGILDAETRQVVFYVTDLSQSAHSDPVWFYTSDDTGDYLSPNRIQQKDTDFHTTDGTFTFIGGMGLYTSSWDTANGMCMGVALTSATPGGIGSDNSCEWDSPFGQLQLVKNNVYQIRCSISGSMTGEATDGQRMPLFDLQVINFQYNVNTGTFHGLYTYAGDSYFFDNIGGEQATWQYVNNGGVFTTVAGSKTYEYWWTPPAVSTTQWNDESETNGANFGPGPWAASSGIERNAMVSWRILDMESNPGINAASAQGTLCMTRMTIDRYDLNDMHTTSTQANGLYNPPMTINVNPTDSGGALRVEGDVVGGWNVSASGGGILIQPKVTIGQADNHTSTQLCLINPGDFSGLDYGNAASVAKDYPVTMAANQLYLIQYELSAPTAADAAAPIDAYWVGADMTTNERIDLSMGTNMAYHHGMPNTTPQMFKAFFATNAGTRLIEPNASSTWWSSLRPRFMAANSNSFAGNEPNTGAIKITKIRVDQVSFQSAPQ